MFLSLLFIFSRKFCQTKVTDNGNNEWFPLGLPYWIRSFQPFRIHSKRPLHKWKKLVLTFLNVTMDICNKTFFYFAKHKDKRIKNNLEKKMFTRNLRVKTFLWPKTTCYVHIDWPKFGPKIQGKNYMFARNFRYLRAQPFTWKKNWGCANWGSSANYVEFCRVGEFMVFLEKDGGHKFRSRPRLLPCLG